MRFLSGLGLTVAVVSAIVLAGSFPYVSSLDSKARTIQRVRVDEGAALFGETGEKIGSPQRMVIDDPKAFIGEGPVDGVWQVDEGYLQKQGIYPLQMQTVNYTAGLARLGSGIGLGIGLIAWWWARRRRSSAA
jgi:hypothetical protein